MRACLFVLVCITVFVERVVDGHILVVDPVIATVSAGLLWFLTWSLGAHLLACWRFRSFLSDERIRQTDEITK